MSTVTEPPTTQQPAELRRTLRAVDLMLIVIGSASSHKFDGMDLAR